MSISLIFIILIDTIYCLFYHFYSINIFYSFHLLILTFIYISIHLNFLTNLMASIYISQNKIYLSSSDPNPSTITIVTNLFDIGILLDSQSNKDYYLLSSL
jgi:hypothetical protein